MIHFIAKKIKNLCIKVNYRWKSFHERRKLQYIDFSIISNNCWAGFCIFKVWIRIHDSNYWNGYCR